MKILALIRKFKIVLPLLAVLLCLTTLTAFSQKPELFVQTGPSHAIFSLALSPDGKTVANGSQSIIELWDTATGRELRKFFTGSQVISVVFSPNGKTLASGHSDHSVRVWDVLTGECLRMQEGHSDRVGTVAFSSDGKMLASGSDDNTIKLWDVTTGSELRTLKGHSRRISTVAFSPDGLTIASGSWDDTIRLWDVVSGQEERILAGNSGHVNSVIYSPDGLTLASGSFGNITLWNVATGQQRKKWVGHASFVQTVAVSADGAVLASVDSEAVKIWDFKTGQQLQSFSADNDILEIIALSSDGKIVAGAGLGEIIKLWDITTGKELRALEGNSELVDNVALSQDGKTLVSKSHIDTIEGNHLIARLWDLTSGQNPRTFGFDASKSFLAISFDNKIIATETEDHRIILSDADTGRSLRTIGEPSDHFSVRFSPDGKIVARVHDKEIKLWDVGTGQELHTIITSHFLGATSVAFSPDSKLLATGSYSRFGDPDTPIEIINEDKRPGFRDETLQLWRVATGREIQALTSPAESAVNLCFSPNGKMLASVTRDSIRLWDLVGGRKVRTLKGDRDVGTLAFSPNGKTLANSSSGIKLWNVATGADVLTLKGHPQMVTAVAFSANNKYLVSGSLDSSLKIWDVTSGEEMASLIALDETEWIVATPDGLFDGSPAAWNKIIWRFNNNTFDYAPVEVYFSDFYYPGLLADIFAGKNPKAPSDITQKDRRQPKVILAGSNVRPDARHANIRIDVSQAPAGAQDVRLFRNGSLVKVWHGDVLKGKESSTLEATVPIVAGENNFTAYAFNRDNVKSSDATLTVKGSDSLKRKGTAYVLAVGVNSYANAEYNLTYAVPDAKDFSDELKRQQEKLGNYARVEIIPLNDSNATKANILKAFSDISAKIQPEDSLTIYFAGHGTAEGNRFYLIPHDLGYTGSREKLDDAGLKAILSHSISDEELEAAVEGIDAGQMLLVIDACNSGQALEAEEKRRGPMNSKGLAQLAYEKGMYILTAAQSYQAAKEAAKLGHGFLTYALVEEGLKTPAADKEPKDGQVLLREWLDFATQRVPEMQQDYQKTRELRKEKSTIPDNVQRPRVFYRRETEPHPMVVARP